MRSLLVSLFGVYMPVMTDVYDSAGVVVGSVVADGVAGVDWPWVAGVVLFGVVLYCFLRMVGGMLHD